MFSPSPSVRLSFAQIQTLELLAAGNSLAEVAAVRRVSAKAVDGMLGTIRRLLEARNSTEAIAVALIHGLIDRAAIMHPRRARGHFGHPARGVRRPTNPARERKAA